MLLISFVHLYCVLSYHIIIAWMDGLLSHFFNIVKDLASCMPPPPTSPGSYLIAVTSHPIEPLCVTILRCHKCQ